MMGTYRTQAFAERAGVTVRTLHHYDRLGLLKPGRTNSGYRAYSDGDFVRIEQIIALKFIGLPLNQIKTLLQQSSLDLQSTLRLQRRILEEKRAQLDKAIEALSLAERGVTTGKATVHEALRKVTDAIQQSNKFDWTRKYYSAEAKHFLTKRRQQNPGIAEEGTRRWQALVADVEQAVREKVDPSSRRGQQLARRWNALIRSFTEGRREVEAGLKKMWADKGNWPSQFRKPY